MPLTVSITPLPLLRRQDASLMRCIRVAVTADPVHNTQRLLLDWRDTGASRQFDLDVLQPGENVKTIFVPEVSGELPVEMLVRYGDERWSGTIRLLPARRWTVHLILHSHTDLGFTDPISTVARIHNENTDRAIDLCQETAAWPEGTRFKWTCEVSWQVQQFIAARPRARVEQLMKLIRDGAIAVGALYTGELTDLLGHEEAVRSFYYAAHLRRHYGIPCDTAMLCDVPGCTTGLVQIMAKAGISNFIIADNNFIAPVLARTDLPRPFWWNGADGTRVLCWYTDHPYYAYIEGEYYGLTQDVHTVEQKLPEKLMALEVAGYPFDHMQLQYAFDNVVLNTRPMEVVREWNALWEYPKIRLSTARECMTHLRLLHAARIPSRTGDWTNWWAGIATGFPSESALTRRCHERAPAAELLLSIATLHDPSHGIPPGELSGVYDGLLAFDEHSGGGTLWNPKSPEEQQQAVREGYGLLHHAAATLTRLESDLSTVLGDMIDNTGKSRRIAVVNSTAIARNGITEWRAAGVEGPQVVVDQTNGQMLPTSVLPGGGIAFHVEGIPPYGYKVYRLEPAQAPRGTPPLPKATARVIEHEVILKNQHYRLAIDCQTGCCVSLYATAAQQECISPGAALNQALVYVSHPVKEIELGKYIPEIYLGVQNPGETTPWPASSRVTVECSQDPVLGALCRVSHTVEGAVWLSQEYRLPHEDAGVHVTNTLYRSVRNEPRLAAALADFLTHKGMLYFAFPFNVPDGVFEYESPAAIIRPSAMQFKGSCHDFFAVQRWCRIASPGLSIAMTCPDTPLVDVGSIGLLRFKTEVDHDQATLYFRGVTLREWGNSNESPYSREEDLHFRFSIDVAALKEGDGGHAVAGRRRAHAFGLASHVPLGVVDVPHHGLKSLSATRHSWCSVSPPSVEVMTLKRAEDGDGMVLRIRESIGEPADVGIAFPGFTIAAASTAMITEEVLEPIEVLDNAIQVRLAPFAIQTFRVTLVGEGHHV